MRFGKILKDQKKISPDQPQKHSKGNVTRSASKCVSLMQILMQTFLFYSNTMITESVTHQIVVNTRTMYLAVEPMLCKIL